MWDLFQLRAQIEKPVPMIESSAHLCQLADAEIFVSTQSLIQYLCALTGFSLSRVIEWVRDGRLDRYLLNRLSENRFTAEAWSKAFSLFFCQPLSFKTVSEAKIWLRGYRVDQSTAVISEHETQ